MTELTEMQRAFVVHFTTTPEAIGNASEAARRAGYSPATAKEQGRQLLAKPHVADAIDAANRAQISGTLATKATALLERIVDNEDAPLRVRLDAAKTILDRGGIIAPRAPEPVISGPKPLEAMTAAELEEFILRTEAELNAHRRSVSETPRP